MDDDEIYSLASRVISEITDALNGGHYRNLNGSLQIKWGLKNTFNAWAESINSSEEPPHHEIGINYELARQIYRDAESFYDFCEGELQQDAFKECFISRTQPKLPQNYSRSECCHNIFIAALTWVYFHEWGHLVQEHGYIRAKYGVSDCALVNELSTPEQAEIEGNASAIYHVTELAADSEATIFCIAELFRHFKKEDMEPALQIFVCAICCVFYRFNSSKQPVSDITHIGTHPNPIIRMEFNLASIYEFLSLPGVELGLSRKTLVEMCSNFGHAVSIWWLMKNGLGGGLGKYFFLEGILGRPEIKGYLIGLVSAWDEISDSIVAIRKLPHSLGLLNFTDEFREYLRN
ncbi:MAG: hypothetical protein EOP04_07760 [Proteobacteria bacterium]|nr:MAG: hypothetical protein EOP04_07760 [Pseudomonadota bacterium]